MVLGPAQSLVVEELLISGEEFVGATFFRQMASECQSRFAVEESRRIVHRFSRASHQYQSATETESAQPFRWFDYHSRHRGGKDDCQRRGMRLQRILFALCILTR